MTKFILGTGNQKKAAELVALLAPAALAWQSLAEFPDAPPVVEDGSTFAENAVKKAATLATALDGWVLGEDSGLSVDALDGRPGIFSARFAGPSATDEENNRKLVEAMNGVADAARTAYYVCSMALCDPSGKVRARAEGRCDGRITNEARGTGGFGYDPYFLIAEYHKTFGELGARVKHHLSHRARAAGILIAQLMLLRTSGAWAADD